MKYLSRKFYIIKLSFIYLLCYFTIPILSFGLSGLSYTSYTIYVITLFPLVLFHLLSLCAILSIKIGENYICKLGFNLGLRSGLGATRISIREIANELNLEKEEVERGVHWLIDAGVIKGTVSRDVVLLKGVGKNVREAVKLMAYLTALEELHKSGEVRDDVYKKLKEEYESKLREMEKGGTVVIHEEGS